MLFDTKTYYGIEYITGFSCLDGEAYLPPTESCCVIYSFKTFRAVIEWVEDGVEAEKENVLKSRTRYTFHPGFRRRINSGDITEIQEILPYNKQEQ